LAGKALQHNKPRTTTPKIFFMNQDPNTKSVHTHFTISLKLLLFVKAASLQNKDYISTVWGTG
jgi:hypothetical protein